MDLGLGLRVQIAGWLIGEQDRRLIHKGSGYGDPLLLASGKLGRLVLHPLSKPHILQECGGGGLGILVRTSGDEGRDHHVLQGVELR